jgi:hypothetical protein
MALLPPHHPHHRRKENHEIKERPDFTYYCGSNCMLGGSDGTGSDLESGVEEGDSGSVGRDLISFAHLLRAQRCPF